MTSRAPPSQAGRLLRIVNAPCRGLRNSARPSPNRGGRALNNPIDDPKPAVADASDAISSASPIRTSFDDHIGIVGFDDYATRNALSKELIAATLAALEIFKTQRARAVILRSAQIDSVWSSGHSVNELPIAEKDPLPYDDPLEQHEMVRVRPGDASLRPWPVWPRRRSPAPAPWCALCSLRQLLAGPLREAVDAVHGGRER